jgi:hypothetical protein
MNLDNLKPAWAHFRVVNSMQQIDQSEMLMMLENSEGMTINKTSRFLIHTFSFLLIIICCQGG